MVIAYVIFAAAVVVTAICCTAGRRGILLVHYSPQPAQPQVTQGTQPPTVEHHVHNHHGPEFHIYGADGQDAAAQLIRKALTEGDHDVPVTIRGGTPLPRYAPPVLPPAR